MLPGPSRHPQAPNQLRATSKPANHKPARQTNMRRLQRQSISLPIRLERARRQRPNRFTHGSPSQPLQHMRVLTQPESEKANRLGHSQARKAAQTAQNTATEIERRLGLHIHLSSILAIKRRHEPERLGQHERYRRQQLVLRSAKERFSRAEAAARAVRSGQLERERETNRKRRGELDERARQAARGRGLRQPDRPERLLQVRLDLFARGDQEKKLSSRSFAAESRRQRQPAHLRRQHKLKSGHERQ